MTPVFSCTPAIFFLDPESEPEKTIYPKIKKDAVLTGEIERFQLVKVWENAENLPTKPTEIVVDIYRDHDLYDTVTLAEANNRSYSREEDMGYEWSIPERKLPEGCSAIYRKDGREYIVVNTYEITEIIQLDGSRMYSTPLFFTTSIYIKLAPFTITFTVPTIPT